MALSGLNKLQNGLSHDAMLCIAIYRLSKIVQYCLPHCLVFSYLIFHVFLPKIHFLISFLSLVFIFLLLYNHRKRHYRTSFAWFCCVDVCKGANIFYWCSHFRENIIILYWVLK